jgi:hypothetical protein
VSNGYDANPAVVVTTHPSVKLARKFCCGKQIANHQLSGKRPFEIYIIDHHGILQLCVTGM